jgi:hypothetical protein
MTFTTTRKEHTMKAQLTTKVAPLAGVLALAASLAAQGGHLVYSDETLKQEIEPLESALAKLRSLS